MTDGISEVSHSMLEILVNTSLIYCNHAHKWGYGTNHHKYYFSFVQTHDDDEWDSTVETATPMATTGMHHTEVTQSSLLYICVVVVAVVFKAFGSH